MIEKNGIDAKSGRKSHISDEDLVGIPKFYNEEHDFYTYNLFDFHKFGLNINAASLVKIIENFSTDFEGSQLRQPYTLNANLYDDEIIEGVKCVSDLISTNPDDYPITTVEDIKKAIINILAEEYLSFKNENTLIFLSGGVDSVLNMLLAKSMGLPAKYVHIYEDKNTTAYIRHLRKRFKLDIDYIDIKDVEITKDFYNKTLTYNPYLWLAGARGHDIYLSAIACLDSYKECQNVMIGIRERYLNQHFWNVYSSVKDDTEFDHYNSKYGSYIKYFPDKEKTMLSRKYGNILERQRHVFKFMRSYVNFEGLTNKNFAKSHYSRNLIKNSFGLIDKEELIKNAYKTPQIELCKEIDPGISLPKWIPITWYRDFPVSHKQHLYNWFINYEKSKY